MSDIDPSGELRALLAALASQRHHVLGILDGLSEAQLRERVLPSGWSPLGLVQHLALDVERFWFRAVVAGESVDLESGGEAWLVPSTTTVAQVFEMYAREAALSNAIIAATPLHAQPAWWPTALFGGLPVRCLRETVLAVISETATHAGHLDAVREALDGHQWLVLT